MRTPLYRLLVLSFLALPACAAETSNPGSAAASEDELRASNDAFIRKMAADLGESFDVGGSAYDDNLERIRLSQLDELDPAWLRAFEARIAKLNQELRGDRAVGDEVYAIVRTGKVIGYVLAVQYHGPSFPYGAGARVYFNAKKQVLESVRWTG